MHFYSRILFHILLTIIVILIGYVTPLGQESGRLTLEIVKPEQQKHPDILVLLNMYLFRKLYRRILLIVSEIIHETIVL